MAGNLSSSSHYQRLVAGFAASAFALLGMLSSMQYEANTVSAAVSRQPSIMTNYHRAASTTCLTIKNKNERPAVSNYRFCRSK